MSELSHRPVLLTEATHALQIKENGHYIDATFGRGGHSEMILSALGRDGRLIVIDKDLEAIAFAKAKFSEEKRVTVWHGSYALLETCVAESGDIGQIDGVLLDLGVSSPQLDDPNRGFSFMQDGPLDMRMNTKQKLTAEKWLNSARQSDIENIFFTYGEERFARRISRAIVNERSEHPIKTTKQLAEIIAKAKPVHEKNKHPATRVFQAIRIFINKEFEELNDCLNQALNILRVGGRLAVISFHSLEDRIVKQFINHNVKGDQYPKKLPITHRQLNSRLKKIGGAVRPTFEEINMNPRARSATLRVAEKTA